MKGVLIIDSPWLREEDGSCNLALRKYDTSLVLAMTEFEANGQYQTNEYLTRDIWVLCNSWSSLSTVSHVSCPTQSRALLHLATILRELSCCSLITACHGARRSKWWALTMCYWLEVASWVDVVQFLPRLLGSVPQIQRTQEKLTSTNVTAEQVTHERQPSTSHTQSAIALSQLTD